MSLVWEHIEFLKKGKHCGVCTSQEGASIHQLLTNSQQLLICMPCLSVNVTFFKKETNWSLLSAPSCFLLYIYNQALIEQNYILALYSIN